ncbi:hypothetical protein ACM5ME_19530 [Bacillus subtilis]|uniref:hypothetical protein n=1 Tax=Bacillus subtilis TaxID=1423 RepID=UPI003AAB251C
MRELYGEGIRRLFHSLHPVHAPLESHVLYPFPSEQTLTAFVIFGFCAYLFVRHSHKARLQTVAFFVDYRFIPHRADRVYALMSSIRVMLLRVAPSAVFGWV